MQLILYIFTSLYKFIGYVALRVTYYPPSGKNQSITKKTFNQTNLISWDDPFKACSVHIWWLTRIAGTGGSTRENGIGALEYWNSSPCLILVVTDGWVQMLYSSNCCRRLLAASALRQQSEARRWSRPVLYSFDLCGLTTQWSAGGGESWIENWEVIRSPAVY